MELELKNINPIINLKYSYKPNYKFQTLEELTKYSIPILKYVLESRIKLYKNIYPNENINFKNNNSKIMLINKILTLDEKLYLSKNFNQYIIRNFKYSNNYKSNDIDIFTFCYLNKINYSDIFNEVKSLQKIKNIFYTELFFNNRFSSSENINKFFRNITQKSYNLLYKYHINRIFNINIPYTAKIEKYNFYILDDPNKKLFFIKNYIEKYFLKRIVKYFFLQEDIDSDKLIYGSNYLNSKKEILEFIFQENKINIFNGNKYKYLSKLIRFTDIKQFVNYYGIILPYNLNNIENINHLIDYIMISIQRYTKVIKYNDYSFSDNVIVHNFGGIPYFNYLHDLEIQCLKLQIEISFFIPLKFENSTNKESLYLEDVEDIKFPIAYGTLNSFYTYNIDEFYTMYNVDMLNAFYHPNDKTKTFTVNEIIIMNIITYNHYNDNYNFNNLINRKIHYIQNNEYRIKFNNLDNNGKDIAFKTLQLLFLMSMYMRKWNGKDNYPILITDTINTLTEEQVFMNVSKIFVEFDNYFNKNIKVKEFINSLNTFQLYNNNYNKLQNSLGRQLFITLYDQDKLCMKISSSIFASTAIFYLKELYNFTFNGLENINVIDQIIN